MLLLGVRPDSFARPLGAGAARNPSRSTLSQDAAAARRARSGPCRIPVAQPSPKCAARAGYCRDNRAALACDSRQVPSSCAPKDSPQIIRRAIFATPPGSSTARPTAALLEDVKGGDTPYRPLSVLVLVIGGEHARARESFSNGRNFFSPLRPSIASCGTMGAPGAI